MNNKRRCVFCCPFGEIKIDHMLKRSNNPLFKHVDICVNISTVGEVGDWKNHFTVAESEQFDRLLEEELKDNKYMQCYF